MDETKISLAQQIKAAERDKLLAKAEKSASKRKILDKQLEQLEYKGQKKIYKKTKFWSIIIGTVVVWAAIGVIVVPLAEMHNIQISLENAKKSDTLYKKDIELSKLSDTLNFKEKQRLILSDSLHNQLLEINSLKRTRHKLDSSYAVLLGLTNSSPNGHYEIEKGIMRLKDYFYAYKQQQRTTHQLISTLKQKTTIEITEKPLIVISGSGHNEQINEWFVELSNHGSTAYIDKFFLSSRDVILNEKESFTLNKGQTKILGVYNPKKNINNLTFQIALLYHDIENRNYQIIINCLKGDVEIMSNESLVN